MKTELESKAILTRYGIATTNPRAAPTAIEAARVARELRGPIAVKVLSADIVHKVAAGGVRLNVRPEEVAAAFESIMTACRASQPDARIEGVLLEEMVPSGAEVFIGARVHDEYGPVVLLGMGGSGVEQGPAPAAALAPITPALAQELVEAAFQGPFGRKLGAGGRQVLANYLVAIAGRDGMIFEEKIGEMDVNPIIVQGGTAIAVDAVVDPMSPESLARTAAYCDVDQAAARRRGRLSGMSALFRARSVAFIGASTSPNKLGYRNIKNLVDFGFKGPVYPIHPTANEICGARAYKSILDVPGPVDRAYVAVAASQSLSMLEDCAKKGVGVVQVLTAGFSEFDQDDGVDRRALESQLRDVVARTPMRMVGPNCIGTFSSSGRLAMGAARLCPTEPGGITFISQSGTFAGDVVRRAQVLGIPVGQSLSCGNCSDLDLLDYLLFCEDDPETSLIAMYVESLRDPGLFFRAAERCRKPIVILKGGTTEQGAAAAGSHTAALATDTAMWGASVRQAGILQVESFQDLIDAMLIQSAHGSVSGNRLGIFGSGGGVSVTCADTAARRGMIVPALGADATRILRSYGGPGTSVRNPIDIPVWGLRSGDRYIVDEVVNALKSDGNVDSIIVYVEMGTVMDFADSDEEGLNELNAICASILRSRREGSPLSVALRSTGDKIQDDFVRVQRPRFHKHGIAVFPSTVQAVRAHAMLWTLSKKQTSVEKR